MIDTGNVNDVDNAKLYVKGKTAYAYITDLSGATGMTGPQGQKGDTGLREQPETREQLEHVAADGTQEQQLRKQVQQQQYFQVQELQMH